MDRLFFTANHRNSELALDFLQSRNVPFKAFDVEKLCITHALEKDIGTAEIPTIVSCDGIFVGLESIKNHYKMK